MLIEFGVPVKLNRLIKMCLKKTCTKVGMGKHLSDTFPCSELSETRRCFVRLEVLTAASMKMAVF
jgi:hypothetical protein